MDPISPEYTDNRTECPQVITEQPPQQHPDLFQFTPEDDNEEESAESVQIVEQALSSTLINEATGYTLKYNGLTCCPNLEIIPKLNQFPVSQEDLNWKITYSSNCFCWFPPITPISGETKWQTMTLKQNEQEILNFMYIPMVCFCKGRKDRLVHIYIPQRNQRIGVFKQGSKFSDEMVLTDCMARSVYLAKTLEFTDCELNSSPFVMTVVNQQGTQIAKAQPTQSRALHEWKTWTDFELEFSTNIPSNLLPLSSKSVVLVAFMIWTINYREENARSTLLWSLAAIIIIILLVGLTIFYDSHYIY